MDFERDHLLLNGTWERLMDHPEAAMWQPEIAAAESWEAVELPGPLQPGSKRQENEKVHCTWGRRTFTLDARQAARLAVLKWGHVRFGATAWLNGTKLGSHAPVGPCTMPVPAGVTKEGENALVLKVNGWASLHKSSTGVPVIPVGADLHWGGRGTSVADDVWLEFYDRARLKRVLALADPAAATVTFRIWLDSAVEMPAEMDLHADVALEGRSVGRAATSVSATEEPFEVAVPVDEVRTWEPDDPQLYTAHLVLSADGNPCDEVRFTFGMRRIAVEGGHFRLNGRPLWFRGSNLVNEWNWGETFNSEVKRYLVDEARNMNLNSFRTHTMPPVTRWLDVCDKYGVMIMAEFSPTFNYRDYAFTPEEWDMWHRNVLTDAEEWITKIGNHPSVVMWVLTNEPRGDDEWEAGPYHDAVVAIDPSRPTMRTGETKFGTPEVVDVHTCGNYCFGPNNSMILTCRSLARSKDPKRALGNSEYMNYLGHREDIHRRRLGSADHPGVALDFAECAAEHTEAMRQLDFDLILPYMYAGWPRFRGNNWRPDFPTPMAAALHSSMAPVLASVELFDRNFRAGSEVEAPLHLINELHREVTARLDVYITPQNPLFVPDAAALEAAVWHEGRELSLKADSHVVEKVRWEVPTEENTYYLAVVLTRQGDRPVVSQRTIRALAAPGKREGAGRVLIAGDAPELERALVGLGVACAPFAADAAGNGGTLLVWGGRLPEDAELRRAAGELAEQGGRVVLFCMEKGGWDAKAEFDWPVPFTIEGTDGSMCVFPYPDAEHPLLRGIRPDWLRVWNGLPNVIADTSIGGQAAEQGQKLLWQEHPDRPVAVRLAMGKGGVLILTLRMDGRLGPGERYDPVAERMLLNLLAP